MTVNSSSLPDPDADGRGPSRLPEGIVLPLMLLPVTCLAFLFVAGGVAQLFVDPKQLEDDSEDPGSPKEGAELSYSRGSSSNSRRSRGQQHRHGHGQHGGLMLRLGASGLISSGRRGLKRLRRGSPTVTRPLYIGDPHDSSAELQRYVTGSIAQSPKKVAPFFRFPPSALPPGLPIILEAPQEGHATIPVPPDSLEASTSQPWQDPVVAASTAAVEVVEQACLPMPTGSVTAPGSWPAGTAAAKASAQAAWFNSQQQQQQGLLVQACAHSDMQIADGDDEQDSPAKGERSWWEWWSHGDKGNDEDCQTLGQLHQRLL